MSLIGRAVRLVLLGSSALAWSLLAASDARADHPLLADDPANTNWYTPQGSNEAIFIGPPGHAEPAIILKKPPAPGAPMTIDIFTDATQCRIESGKEAFVINLAAGRKNRLILDSSQSRPTLSINGQELSAYRGRWIRLALKSNEPTLALRMLGGTYANLNLRLRDRSEKGAALLAQRFGRPNVPDDSAVPGRDEQHPYQSILTELTRAATYPAHGGRSPIVAAASSPGRPLDYLDPVTGWDLSLAAGLQTKTHYFFRGLGQENQDLILELFADGSVTMYQNPDAPVLSRLGVDFGFISHHHGGPSSEEITGQKWYEFDWWGGLSATAFDRFTLSVHPRQRTGIEGALDVHMVDLALRYDDHDPNYDWQLNPYAILSFEYENQSDRGLRPFPSLGGTHDEGIYLELGVRPKFEVGQLSGGQSVILSVPVQVGLSLDDYYEDLSGRDDTFGYFDLGVELEIPLMSAAAGADHSFNFAMVTGVHLLVLGDSARDISQAAGTGGDAVEIIGSIGVKVDY